MTAPLQITNQPSVTSTLQSMTYKLLDAIDTNNIEDVELAMSSILKYNTPETILHMFYTYAQNRQREDICTYFKLVLLSTYNTCNI